jgi:hypothetical protein
MTRLIRVNRLLATLYRRHRQKQPRVVVTVWGAGVDVWWGYSGEVSFCD